MNNNEFEAWLLRNVKNVGKGGSIPSIDPFNKAKTGSERNERPEEYPMNGVEEYHHYNERYTPYQEDDEKRRDSDDSSESRSRSDQQSYYGQARSTSYSRSRAAKASKTSNTVAKATQSVVRNIIPKVVLVVVGSVVVVTSYQTMKEHEAAKANQTPVAYEAKIDWGSEDSGATFSLWDENGNLIKEITAVVVTSQVDPTCTKKGSITYTATAEDGEKTYSETRTEVIAAKGHAFGEGKEIILENGDHAVEFECSGCHEKFTITTSIEEDE